MNIALCCSFIMRRTAPAIPPAPRRPAELVLAAFSTRPPTLPRCGIVVGCLLRGLSFFPSFAELLTRGDQPGDWLRDLAVERRGTREKFLQMSGLASSLTVLDL